MKILKKAAAAALAAGILVAATSCADTSWSYKDDKNTLPVGTYIYYMSGAYSFAKQSAQSEVEVTTDADGATEATEAVDVMTAKIKDNKDKEVTGKDYILNTASNSSKALLFTLKKFDELGLKLSDSDKTQIDTLTTQSWAYSGSSYEKLGISKDSYRLAYAEFSTKYEAVFKKLYNKGGEFEVSADDLKKYYTDNYVDYSYLPMNLYTTVESSDQSADSSASTTKALSDKEIKEAKEKFDGYAKDINDGKKSFDEIDTEFMKDQKVATSSAVTNQELLDSSSAPADIINEVKKLKTGEASVITVGEGDTAVMYLVSKGDIKDSADGLAKDESKSYSVLTNMKKDEFENYINEQAEKMEVQENSAAFNQYTPEELEKKMNEITSANASSNS